MQRKLKAVLGSSGRKRAQSSADETKQSYEAADPRGEQHTSSHRERGWSTSSDSPEDPIHAGRSRPLTSGYDSRPSAPQSAAVAFAQPKPSDSNASIANDYRAYLPVLDASKEQHMTLGGDRRLIAGESGARHEEEVADRNIDRYSMPLDAGQGKALPMLPNHTNADHDGSRNHSTGTGLVGSTIRVVPPGPSTGKYVESRDNTPNSLSKRTSWPAQSVRDEYQAGSAEGLRTRQDMSVKHRGDATNVHPAGMDGQQDWKAQQQALLGGVVDLRDTVDTHRHVQMAPAVTHEVIKPHEHEIIQHKIHREIHNYSYYHRLQPVYHTEVLPPRHFIPNPHGEGLIEVSADELPSRTGEHRWWEIVQKSLPLPKMSHQWRTEPEVIEGKTYITDEGFERRETTIRYPPTLESMEGYGGPIQPVHFDHKTGERWLGEVTTMDKLREELNHVSESDTMKFKELRESLPEIPPSPTIKRKPVDW
ncbi:uncharacterized protein K460DRAFT_410499 [Cucurbitaria berberidis CBS 394.84]|uniref:Uncharacterized protein n=1 Tax=Cucurbitaria berberidis CBS 394.84 TaxID=1168544 RepID=A0A9P4G8M0_9PLEO|nr:uncharacterized protein K460DRAFT_410499 [Cucurbitaria berberidis CBS 394.84]KAF1841108.1 hypothetical protein K460DRAFT_410499 [Cucurbitaria berberidis CBS 394.84]